LKNLSADALAFTADGKMLIGFFDLYLLERFEILLDIGPLKPVLLAIMSRFVNGLLKKAVEPNSI
jgi:hypothetical protein